MSSSDDNRPVAALVTSRMASGQPTGIGRYARLLAEALAADSEWRVVLATPSESGSIEWAGSGEAVPEVRRLRGRLRVLQASLFAGLPLPIDRWLGDPDVVHMLNPFVPLPTKAPLVATIHDVLPMTHPEWFGLPQRTMFRRAVSYLLRRPTRLITDSQYVATQLADQFPDAGIESRTTVVHCGLDDRFRAPVAAQRVDETLERYGLERGRYLLALGVMSARESPDVIIDALGHVDRNLLGTPSLVLTGPKRFGADRVEAAIERGGLSGRVLLAGFVPDDDLVPLIAGAAALTHSSRDEGFGFTVLEAMAVGTPVIASRAGSLPEVIADGGLLVPPDDVNAWAEAIERVASDPVERARVVAAGSARQAVFSWTRAAAETAAVYRQAADVRG